jgi:hypothetical protein
MSDTPTFGRYAEIPYDEMTPEQQEAYRLMIESRGGLPGPSKIWIHNPKLAKVAGPFGAHFRHHVATATTLDGLCDVGQVPYMFYRSTRP